MLYAISYAGDGRSLKKLILALLKSGSVDSVKRVNYVKSYRFVDNKIVKQEEKLVLFDVSEAKISQFTTMLKKLYPEYGFLSV